LCLVGFALDVTDGVAETGVPRPFLAADVSPRHRTAIDCQTRATRLPYCSALDPFAPFGTHDGRCPRAAAAADRSHALELTQEASSSVAVTSQAHCVKEIPVVGVRQPPTEQSRCLRCPRRARRLLPVQATATGYLKGLRSLLAPRFLAQLRGTCATVPRNWASHQP
jgi:hypothetical protein